MDGIHRIVQRSRGERQNIGICTRFKIKCLIHLVSPVHWQLMDISEETHSEA